MFPVCVLHDEITMKTCNVGENAGFIESLSALTLLVFPAAAVIFIVTVYE